MLEGNNIVEQALEVAKIEAQAELANAEASLSNSEAIIASSEAIANTEPTTSDAVQVAEIEAARDIAVAEVVATTHEDGCCDTCRATESRLTQLESDFRDHSTRMNLEMATLREKKEPDVTSVPVQDVKEKKPKTEKKEDKKPIFGKLMLG